MTIFTRVGLLVALLTAVLDAPTVTSWWAEQTAGAPVFAQTMHAAPAPAFVEADAPAEHEACPLEQLAALYPDTNLAKTL